MRRYLASFPSPGPRWLLAGVAAALLVACTDTSLRRPPEPEEERADNLLRVEGEYCTKERRDVAFPVKVLYVLDQSFSLQFTDPDKKRYAAAGETLETLANQPNVEFAFVGFSSWSRTSTTDDRVFSSDKSDVEGFLRDPEDGLGVATDYQGALATALRVLERDIKSTERAERARTRYVVNFISDGVPNPQCSQGCDDEDSELCNSTEDEIEEAVEEDEYVGFEGACPAYNSSRQIVSRVQDIVNLDDDFDLGDVRLNSVLLFSSDPAEGAEEIVDSDREEAAQILRNMADEGDGEFRDVDLAGAEGNFLDFEVTSVEADRALTTMFTENAFARRIEGEMLPDVDGDGLPDPYERENGLDPERRDTDGDGYSDGFEKALLSEGFDPAEGSIPSSDCQSEADRDGEGLLDCEEQVVGTDPNQPDSDGDDMSDWLEILAGTDPLEGDANIDTDNDGVSNLDEIRGGTGPSTPDAETFRNDRIRYDVEELGTREFEASGEQRRCYSYEVGRIPMATTPIDRNRGLNRILIRGAEGPTKIAGLAPEVQTACVEAFFNDGEKRPADGVVELSQETIDRTRESVSGRVEELAACELLGDGAGRAEIESFVEECMGPTIEVGNRLYDVDEIFTIMRRHLTSGLDVRLPDRSFEFFKPLASFDPNTDCFRPWEIDQLEAVLQKATAACSRCAAEMRGGADANSGPEL